MPAFGLDPNDAANRALLAEVHPPEWANPTPARMYDLVVIGGGTAGLVAAAGGAGLGAKVALVERGLLGGDCLNFGCVPSKALLAAADAWHRARGGSFGAPVAEGSGDFGVAMQHVREARAAIAPHDSARRFADLGIDVFLGSGKFASRRSVVTGDTVLRFRRAVIATGARPVVPGIPGIGDVPVLTNESIFELREKPEALVIIGAGPIGCEMAQAFARFGTRVTLLDSGDRILPNDEPDAAAIVADALRADGVEVLTGISVERVRSDGGRILVDVLTAGNTARSLPASHLLASAGRAANVEGLDLGNAGVSFSRGGIDVDDSMRTSNSRIYASGDVASARKFTHLADAQSRIVLTNSLFPARSRASRLVVPWCTYTSPELAQTGMTRAVARERGVELEEITIDFADVDRAIVENRTDGFLRILVAPRGGRILGATVVGDHAGEIISTLTLALVRDLKLDEVAPVIHPYPSRSEAIRKAADAWRRRKLTPVVRRSIAAWFRLRR